MPFLRTRHPHFSFMFLSCYSSIRVSLLYHYFTSLCVTHPCFFSCQFVSQDIHVSVLSHSRTRFAQESIFVFFAHFGVLPFLCLCVSLTQASNVLFDLVPRSFTVSFWPGRACSELVFHHPRALHHLARVYQAVPVVPRPAHSADHPVAVICFRDEGSGFGRFWFGKSGGEPGGEGLATVCWL